MTDNNSLENSLENSSVSYSVSNDTLTISIEKEYIPNTQFTNPFSEEIFKKTYCWKHETLNEAHIRIAKDLASIEKDQLYWQNKFAWALENFKFVPGGRIMSNAGINLKKTTYINCFVDGFQGPDIDSIESIHRALGRQMHVIRSEGGIGLCQDPIRPRGGYIEGIANESPGAVQFIKYWDVSAAILTAGSGKISTNENAKMMSRKGAQMVTMSVWHPDIEEFITIKQTPGNLTQFNMSVLVSDVFINAVKSKEMWNLEFPDYEIPEYKEIYKAEWDGNLSLWKSKGYPVKVYKTLPAEDIWNLIMTSTYNRAEPGVLFIDTINRKNNLYYCEYINATNPCLTDDMPILTDKGYIQIKDLIGKQFNALINGKLCQSTEAGFFHTGFQPVYRIILNDNSVIRATPNHRFKDHLGDWVYVKDLVQGFKLLSYDSNVIDVFSIELENEPSNVYDCTIPDGHEFICGTLVSHNCGEIVLPHGGVCLLGSLNLTQFVNKEQTGFDYSELEKIIPIAIRMMDNVNDVSNAPLPENKYNMTHKRRLGFGVFGYASALYLMKKKYGSPEVLDLTNNLLNFITNTSYQASAMLAKEKGSFPLYDKEKFLAGEHVKILSTETINMISEYGIRNSHIHSNQPTGNSSVFANNISSGLEPIFMQEYLRTSNQGFTPEGLVKPSQVDWINRSGNIPSGWEWALEGKDTLLKTVHQSTVYKFSPTRGLLKVTPLRDYAVDLLMKEGKWDPSADWAVTTSNMTIDDHLNTLNIFAKYACSAISKTVNVPNNYPYEDFKNIYLKAWETGNIKGVTTYRENTMENVLAAATPTTPDNLSSATTPDRPSTPGAPSVILRERPREVECNIHPIRTKDFDGVVVVGLVNDRPFEVFAFKYDKIRFASIQKGTLIKNNGTYSLQTPYITIDDIVSLFSSSEESNFTRMVSLSLRAGLNVNEVYSQLSKCTGSVVSFSKAIARTLSKYTTSDILKSKECTSCNDPNGLMYTEGCLKCQNCGWSKCS